MRFLKCKDSEVTARVEMGEFTLAPCSILAFESVSGSPSGKPFIEAKDNQGRSITDTRVSFEDEGEYRLLLQIGDPQHNICAPPKDEFRLRVVNHSTRVVYMWLGDEPLGPVPINRSEDFGTIPYGWRKARELNLRDEIGQRLTETAARGGTGSVKFVMGETPAIVWWIDQGWPPPTPPPTRP